MSGTPIAEVYTTFRVYTPTRNLLIFINQALTIMIRYNGILLGQIKCEKVTALFVQRDKKQHQKHERHKLNDDHHLNNDNFLHAASVQK